MGYIFINTKFTYVLYNLFLINIIFIKRKIINNFKNNIIYIIIKIIYLIIKIALNI